MVQPWEQVEAPERQCLGKRDRVGHRGTAMRGTDTAWNRQELLTRKKENKFNQEYGQTLEERSRDAMGEIQNSAPKEQSK